MAQDTEGPREMKSRAAWSQCQSLVKGFQPSSARGAMITSPLPLHLIKMALTLLRRLRMLQGPWVPDVTIRTILS